MPTIQVGYAISFASFEPGFSFALSFHVVQKRSKYQYISSQRAQFKFKTIATSSAINGF